MSEEILEEAATVLRRAFEEEGCYLARFFANGRLHLPPEAETTAAFERIAAALSPLHAGVDAKNARLREALEPLSLIPVGSEIFEDRGLILYRNGHNYITVGDVLDARAALQGESKALSQTDSAQESDKQPGHYGDQVVQSTEGKL